MSIESQLIFLGLSALSFVVFLVQFTVKKKTVSARVRKQGASPFLGLLPMEYAYWCLGPIDRIANSLRLSPNFFSWSCFILGFVASVFLAQGSMALGALLSAVSFLCDSLDGMVARSRGIASDAGEVLDAAIDRYTEFFFLGGLCIYYRFSVLSMLLVLFTLLGSLLVSYSQAKAESLQIDPPKGFMRRPERAVYLCLGAFFSPIFHSYIPGMESSSALHYPLLFSLALVGVFSNLTAVRRFVFLYQKLTPNSP